MGQVGEFAVRFVFGGALISAFALLGDLFKPKTFSGLFAAAPSVALASLILAVNSKGAAYAAVEARSMVVGALAFLAYTSMVSWTLARRLGRPRTVATLAILAWLIVATAGWAFGLRSAT